MLKNFYKKINAKILIVLLILFTLTGIVVSLLNMHNLQNIHKNSFNERVLITNNLIATIIDEDDINHYVELMRNQDDAFKHRQYQFHMDREELYRLQEVEASEDQQADVIARMEQFHHDMDALKSDEYWSTIDALRKLKEASGAAYLYVFADTGVTDDDGNMLYTYIFDAEDVGVYDSPQSDGLGTVAYGVDDVADIYRTKKQMEKVFYYNAEPYGELYYAYAPVLDSNGNVLALLGTDLALGEMFQDITHSVSLFNTVFIAFMVIIILVIYIFFTQSVTKPLGALIGTAQRIAKGDIYATVPPTALRQRNELGILAHTIDEMSDVYQSMIVNRVILDSNPFACIIFDKKMNVMDCNPKALDFYNVHSSAELNNCYREILASAIPEYQPDGIKSIPFSERIKEVIDNGYCEFDTYLCLFGRLVPFTIIMKMVQYKNQPAIVAYQFDLSVQKEIQRNLEYRGKLLQAVSDVSDLLLTASTDGFERTLYDAFEIMGSTVSADRVYIWKNHTDDDGKLFMSQIYEWSPDMDPQQGNELTIDIPYDEVITSWGDTLFKGQCLNNLVKNLSKEEQEQLMPQGIVSLLIAPIFIQNKFWGFIGFDDCHEERIFTKTEENILRTLGYMTMVISDTVQNEIAMNLVTAREEALTTARTKSNFLANMSHEIRTPMNAILGMTELILHEDPSDTVLSHATDIKSACRGLLAIINDILDFSKIESGKLEIMPVRYQTASLLIDVINIIKMRADTKRLPFVVNIDANIPSELVGDEIRVKQILINLLNNAVKFTHEGHIKLSVSGELSNEQFLMKCSVSDTGIGIKHEDKEMIFASFERIDTRKNRNIEGTGLGLSISKQLIEMMDGSITVESEYETGSCFTVVISQDIANSLPMTALKPPEKVSVLVYENRNIYLNSLTYTLKNLGCRYKTCTNQSELYELLNEYEYDYIFVSSLYANKTQIYVSQQQPNTVVIALNGGDTLRFESDILSISMPIHSLQIANILNNEYGNMKNESADNIELSGMIAPDAKVLVVDDNIVNLKVAAGFLKTYEINTDTATSGMRALEMVMETAYDLIFMDHMMPEMDGIDTTIAIRGLDGGRFARLPIIALTANAISGAREMFKAEGLNDYLAKPIEMSKLNATLKKWIPKEKQIYKVKSTVGCEDVDLEISGLDIKKGITYAGGSFENYLDILATYFTDGEKRLKDIMRMVI